MPVTSHAPRTRALYFLPLVVVLACHSESVPAPPPTAEHIAAVETWRARRDGRLRSEDGWLSLVGLYWLAEGENRFGSDPANEIVFPANAPARAGSLLLAEGKVTLRAEPNAAVTDIEGRPLSTQALASDADGEPTLVRLGTLSFYVIQRGDKLGVRLKDSQSAVRTGFKGIESFPIASQWRVEARLERQVPQQTIPIPTILGTIEDSPSPGSLVFTVDGREVRLDPILEEGSDDLFVIFGDQTNGHETYGAGRFVYAKPADAEGKTVLDFNQSYNPPCVFTPYATCPLPPPQNKLKFRIEAGEKMVGAQHVPGGPGAAVAPAAAPR